MQREGCSFGYTNSFPAKLEAILISVAFFKLGFI